MTTTNGKKCAQCKEWKPFEDFYKNRSTTDGYQTYCKPCFQQSNKQSKLRHLEKRREQARLYAEENRRAHPEKTKELYKDWYDRNGQEYFRDWQNQNRQSVQENTRRWRSNHPLASQISGNNTRSKRE